MPTELNRLLRQPLVQRLRRISQTGLTSAVYPAATGSRFEHSLGAMHLARRAFARACANAEPATLAGFLRRAMDAKEGVDGLGRSESQRTPEEDAAKHRLSVAVGCVALLHDVGHAPFSHALEEFLAEQVEYRLKSDPAFALEWSELRPLEFHDRVGLLFTRKLLRYIDSPLKGAVETIYEADPDDQSWAGVLRSIVAGDIDTDRLDYLVRDAQKMGTEFGAIDVARLLDSLTLVEPTIGAYRIVPSLRARSAYEALFIQRSQSYRWVFFHPRVQGTNIALARALESLFFLGASPDLIVENISAKEIFSRFLPNLNYIQPDLESLERLTGPRILAALSLRHASDTDEAALRILNSVDQQLRAEVDDASIVVALRHSSTAAAAILKAHQHSGAVAEHLQRLITYTSACLDRAKTFVSVWKSPEEYSVVASQANSGDYLTNKLKEAKEELLPSSGQQTLRSALALRAVDEVLVGFHTDDVLGLNRLIRWSLNTRATRDRIRNVFQAVVRDERLREYYCELGYSGSAGRYERAANTMLWDGNQEVELQSASPIVADLEHADERRPWMTAFIFSPSLKEMDDDSREAVRENSRESFAVALRECSELLMEGVLAPSNAAT